MFEKNPEIDNWVGKLVAKGANICLTGGGDAAKTYYLSEIVKNDISADKRTLVLNQWNSFDYYLKETRIDDENFMHLFYQFLEDHPAAFSQIIAQIEPEVFVTDDISSVSEKTWDDMHTAISQGIQLIVTANAPRDKQEDNLREKLSRAHFDLVIETKDGTPSCIYQPTVSGKDRILWITDSRTDTLRQVEEFVDSPWKR